MLEYNEVYDWMRDFQDKSYCENRDFRNRRCRKCKSCKEADKEHSITKSDMFNTANKIALEDHKTLLKNLDDVPARKILAEAGTYAIRRFQQRMEKRKAEAIAAANAPSLIESLYEVYTEGLQHKAHRTINRVFGDE